MGGTDLELESQSGEQKRLEGGVAVKEDGNTGGNADMSWRRSMVTASASVDR